MPFLSRRLCATCQAQPALHARLICATIYQLAQRIAGHARKKTVLELINCQRTDGFAVAIISRDGNAGFARFSYDNLFVCDYRCGWPV